MASAPEMHFTSITSKLLLLCLFLEDAICLRISIVIYCIRVSCGVIIVNPQKHMILRVLQSIKVAAYGNFNGCIYIKNLHKEGLTPTHSTHRSN